MISPSQSLNNTKTLNILKSNFIIRLTWLTIKVIQLFFYTKHHIPFIWYTTSILFVFKISNELCVGLSVLWPRVRMVMSAPGPGQIMSVRLDRRRQVSRASGLFTSGYFSQFTKYTIDEQCTHVYVFIWIYVLIKVWHLYWVFLKELQSRHRSTRRTTDSTAAAAAGSDGGPRRTWTAAGACRRAVPPHRCQPQPL